MLAAPNSAGAGDTLALPPQTKKPQTFLEIFGNLGMTALKVSGGYIAFVVLATAIHFPYHVDELGAPKIRKEAGTFYADIYSPPAVTPEAPATAEDSKYVKIAREAIEKNRIVPRITAFAKEYGLADKRVLDVGAGTGYLQDVVPDYVGLDISPSARRYFHKPFVEASATDMPFRDNEFDALWSVWVLEHVPKPEQALVEIRRVTKDGGLLFLEPAWGCPWWFAQGYEVRPYSDFGVTGKMKKASLNVVASPYYQGASLMPIRLLRQMQARWSGEPTRFHYHLLEPNYEQYWVADSDAVKRTRLLRDVAVVHLARGRVFELRRGAERDFKNLILRIHKK